jgi:hypothetical protein
MIWNWRDRKNFMNGVCCMKSAKPRLSYNVIHCHIMFVFLGRRNITVMLFLLKEKPPSKFWSFTFVCCKCLIFVATALGNCSDWSLFWEHNLTFSHEICVHFKTVLSDHISCVCYVSYVFISILDKTRVYESWTHWMLTARFFASSMKLA